MCDFFIRNVQDFLDANANFSFKIFINKNIDFKKILKTHVNFNI